MGIVCPPRTGDCRTYWVNPTDRNVTSPASLSIFHFQSVLLPMYSAFKGTDGSVRVRSSIVRYVGREVELQVDDIAEHEKPSHKVGGIGLNTLCRRDRNRSNRARRVSAAFGVRATGSSCR